nr:DEAD/DEAH box helicase family protein [Chitinophaga nivalis]
MLLTTTCVGNNLTVSEETLLSNLIRVQTTNQLREDELSAVLEKLWYNEEGDAKEVVADKTVVTDFPNYSLEMETGTGKTYVYLRTIYELNKVYGLKKFVIVVPSVAIREGVLNSLQATHEHFQEIYDNEPTTYRVYDAARLAELGDFSRSNTIQILVINIDAFTKDVNVINQVRETGIRPIEFIRQSRPVVIMDEPQNMETDIRKKAIAGLRPLFTLRYSATHKNPYNLVYKLDPVRAYDLGLVKQIEVDAVVAKNDQSGTYISLDAFKVAKEAVTAKITLLVQARNGVQKKQVTVKAGSDLFALSKGVAAYQDGFVVNELDAANGCITFSGGKQLYKGEATGGLTADILKEMIDATVENHFKKEKALRAKGIKVLSVFFIDKVANYRSYTAQGQIVKGKFALWFEESFTRWQQMPEYRDLFSCSAEAVHNGYFSQDKGKLKDSKEGKLTKADDEVFRLIMQEKEQLLDMSVPLRFIFSHSALREGWDNPNVFQICTLNETRSDIKKRQEIGRGLRLCVDQSGLRNSDREVNRLTVIANESYDSFSRSLQQEIETDCGVKFEGRIKNVRERVAVKLKNKWQEDAGLLALWEKIKYQATYTVNFSTPALIAACVKEIQAMPVIEKPVISRVKHTAQFIRDQKNNLVELGGVQESAGEKSMAGIPVTIPDIVGYIQSKTALTRHTATEIMLQSGRLGEIFNNPQLFMDTVTAIMRRVLEEMKVKGVRYERIAGQVYEMKLFEAGETEQYTTQLVAVNHPEKTLYNYITTNALSTAEKQFAMDCDNRDDILFYTRLPPGFRIKTPVGDYTPGWALIKREETGAPLLFFVTATVADRDAPGSQTKLKMSCAKQHFEAMDQVHYKVVKTVTALHQH